MSLGDHNAALQMVDDLLDHVDTTAPPAAVAENAPGEEINVGGLLPTHTASHCYGAALLEALDSSVVRDDVLQAQISYFAAQHASLVAELQHVGETLSTDMLDSVESMRRSSVVLEGIFARIDILDDLLVLISKVVVGPVQAAVKAVHAPRDIKGKATSVLRSLGFKSRSMEDDVTGAIWARIPPVVSVSCSTVPDRIFSSSSIAAEVAIPVGGESADDVGCSPHEVRYEKPNQVTAGEFKSIVEAVFEEYHKKMDLLESRIRVERGPENQLAHDGTSSVGGFAGAELDDDGAIVASVPE